MIQTMSAVVVMIMMMCCNFVVAHPPVTFSSVTYEINPPVKVNETYKLRFVITDLWNNNKLVSFSQLLPMHGRMMHVMIGSPDMETMYHVHLEDFYDPFATPNSTVFWVPVTLPRAGVWSFAASFMANVTGGPREGAGLFEFAVSGNPPQDALTVDYSTSKAFKTYPIGSNQVFDSPINIFNNTDPHGYTVSVTFGNNGKGNINNITAYSCQTFFFEVTNPDGTPATNLVPFLDASAHVIWQAEEDTTYHGHAALLTKDVQTYDKLVSYTKMMNTDGSMMMDMSDQDNAMIMEGLMMGINPATGAINCTSDMAAIMERYNMDFSMPMLPANLTFGPRFIGAFDFPNNGVWRLYIYMQVKEGGQTRLLVPDFTIRSGQITAPTTTPTASTTSQSQIASSAPSSPRVSFVPFSLLFASSLLFVVFSVLF